MYKVENKKLIKIDNPSFSDLKLRERPDLQEWICSDEDSLCEPLLFIQKEFEQFQGTKERLDLLALDKKGNIVIIENKTDDSGKDVVWQAVKYAAYCSEITLKKSVSLYGEHLKKLNFNENVAKERILEFLDIDSQEFDFKEDEILNQRIILVSKSFPKEVLSTVLWLYKYKIDIACIEVELSKDNDSLFINFKRILPQAGIDKIKLSKSFDEETKKIEESQIKRKNTNYKFWRYLLDYLNNKTNFQLFERINPSKENWLSKTSGINGVQYVFKITSKTATVRLDISGSGSTKEWCKKVFDELSKYKEQIESNFKDNLIWNRCDEVKGCYIYCKLLDFNLSDENEWQSIIEQLSVKMENLYDSFQEFIKTTKKNIKSNGKSKYRQH